MLAKITSKNQITIPKKIMAEIADAEYFDVKVKDGKISLTPLRISDTNLKKVRTKMKNPGLKSNCVAEAVKWVRAK